MSEVTEEIKEKALQSYKDADKAGRKQLEVIFGKDFFPREGLELLQDYQDACKFLGVDPDEHLPYKDPQNSDDELANVQRMYTTYCKAVNKMDDFVVDFKNGNQEKHYCWIYLDENEPGGVGFSHSHSLYATSRTGSSLGSRFCYFRNPDIAKFVFENSRALLYKLLTL